ncbi:MAG: TIGR02281 family clan AA aspartic protease [Alphaproteobacteria bacterium]|nr:MAG: TIGR02281 family clan AA aspartic protease [Alphaproteobacteria bacterium]
MSESPWSRPPRAGRRPRPRGGMVRRLLWWLLGLLLLLVFLRWLFPGSGIDSPGEILAVATLVTIGSALVLSLRLHYREFLRNLAIWSAIILVLALGYAFRHEIGYLGDRLAGAARPARGYEAGEAMVFERDSDGHFHIAAEVDGTTVTFLLDTGASHVILSARDARRLGLAPPADAFVERYRTGNGIVRAAPVVLRRVRIGDIVLDDVRASVSAGDFGASVFGMSALARLSGVEMRDDLLILRP